MNRDLQQKEQLVRKFEEVLPFLKRVNRLGWIEPTCMADPVYEVFPDDTQLDTLQFEPFVINVKTGWHSEVVYRDNIGVHRIKAGTVDIKNEWSDYCYKANCICKEENK